MNALFDSGREGFLDGSINWGDDIRVALVGAGYTPNLATHKFVGDLGANIIARSGSLSSKTAAAGIADAADVTVTVGASQPTVNYVAVYKNTGADGTSRLIALIDTGNGLPFNPAPGGGDCVITWSNATTKIFKL